jgi:hypothetical protein
MLNVRNASALCRLACTALLLAACAGTVAEVEGRAKLEESAETTTTTGKSLVVQYSVSNVGSLRITRSAVDFRAKTGAHTYYFTAVDTTPIPAGATIYAAASVQYYSGTEALVPGSAEIIGSFFEP